MNRRTWEAPPRANRHNRHDKTLSDRHIVAEVKKTITIIIIITQGSLLSYKNVIFLLYIQLIF